MRSICTGDQRDISGLLLLAVKHDISEFPISAVKCNACNIFFPESMDVWIPAFRKWSVHYMTQRSAVGTTCVEIIRVRVRYVVAVR